MKELLGIPDDVTEIAMFPVAWTVGTDFKPARRHPAREIAYFDGYARTYERGPSDPVCMADGPGTAVEADIRADPAAVWAEDHRHQPAGAVLRGVPGGRMDRRR